MHHDHWLISSTESVISEPLNPVLCAETEGESEEESLVGNGPFREWESAVDNGLALGSWPGSEGPTAMTVFTRSLQCVPFPICWTPTPSSLPSCTLALTTHVGFPEVQYTS